MNFPVMIVGEFQARDIDRDVTFNKEKFCGGSSGAVMHIDTDKIFSLTY